MLAGDEIPLVGREEELAILHQALDRAMKYSTPQSVMLVGNQGVGKTRLVSHWLTGIKEQRLDLRIFQAKAVARGPSYDLFTQLLRARFGLLDAADPAEALRAEVEQVLQDRRVAEVIHFLGTFVGVTVPGNPFLRALEDTAGQHDPIARTMLMRFLEQDALTTPLVLVLEDLHLADEASLSLFREVCEQIEGAPLVLVATCRPELFVRMPQLSTLEAEHMRVDLPLLVPEASEAQLRHLLAPVADLPQVLIDTAVEMTGGNPLFMEQFLRILFDNGVVSVEGNRLLLKEDGLDKIDMPLSVEEAVHARIANLSSAERDVLEKAASLGAVFWLEALICLSRLQQEVENRNDLWAADVHNQTISELLDGLTTRDYIMRLPDSSIPGTSEFAFKHNLERELIASMIHPQKRERYHLFAAQWLETRLPDRSEAQLEYLGQQYQDGGNRRRAAFCFIYAADKARARYANEQAAAYYRKGIDLLDLNDAFSKLEALHNLGEVLMLLGRNDEALEQFYEMLRHAWLLDHKLKGGTAHRRLGVTFISLGDYERASSHLNIALRLFRGASDDRGLSATMDDVGKLYRLRGENEQALEFHRQALEIKRRLSDERGIAVSLNCIGRVHQDSASFQEALDCYVEALDIRKKVGDHLGVVDSLTNLGGVYRAKSDYSRAFELWTEGLELAQEMGARIDEASLRINLAEAQHQLGKPKQAEELLQKAAELLKELGDQRLRAAYCCTLAEVRLARGDLDQAEKLATEASEVAKELSIKPQLGAAYRVLGEVVAARELNPENQQRAAGLFRQAIDIWSELGNDLELARTFAVLADYHDRCGSYQDADHFRSSADEIFARLK